MDNKPALPPDIPFDPENPPDLDDLPALPDGMEWAIKIEAAADVVHADGTVN